jgi:UDP-N-acetylmuramoyl-tripeptide--D-alanyl-D-alanine ligase
LIALADIFEALTGARPQKNGLSFKEVTFHSKRVHTGSLFIAMPSEHKDGHTYIGDAFHRGARAAIVQRDMTNLFPVIDLRGGALPDTLVIPKVPFCLWVEDTGAALQKIAGFWCAKINPTVVAIAGCTPDWIVNDLVAAILSQRWPVIRRFDQPGDLVTLCFDLLQLKKSEECVILEIHPNELSQMKRMLEITRPQVGLAIRPPYIPSPGDPCPAEMPGPELYDLFTSLPPAPRGAAVLNYDHPEERQLARQVRTRHVFYGLNPLADLWADEIEGLGQEGIHFHIHYRFEALALRSPILGRNSVHTALQAAAVGLALGLTWQEIANGLRMDGNGLRLVAVRTASGATLVDDTYSNSSDSALAALNLINQFEGRKIVVLGEIPDISTVPAILEMVGTRAAEVCEGIIAVGEKARPLIEGARRSRIHSQFLIWVPNPQEAIRELVARIRPEDIILVKGSQSVRMDSIVTALEGLPA